jgi:2-oxoglutarate ferredoxin oxidoreductase subunit delta
VSGGKSKLKRRVVSELTVDLDLCKACGICHELCPRDVFDLDERGRPIVARLAACTVCRSCEFHCPDFAITVSFREEAREPVGQRSGG